MCHLVLLLPLLGLPVFWIFSLPIAATSYTVILALSLWLYYYVIKAMRQPVETGSEGLLRRVGTVVAGDSGRPRVYVASEYWNARSSDALKPGDRIKVVGLDGLTLRVNRID